jgi:replicative superfamily II helicase
LFVEYLLGCETPAERSLYRSARIALYQNYHLSVVKALRETSQSFSPEYVIQLVKSNLRLLLPPQYRAISNSRILERWNLIVALPTSSGKTFLGELLLVASLNSGPGLSVYVAPYVDLGKQISDTLSVHLPPGHRLHQFVGGFRQSEPLDPTALREVVVATPERLV